MPRVAYDFSSIPVFAAEREHRPQSQPRFPATPSHGIIQPKLAIRRSDDPLEDEADRVTDKVMRMPDKAGPMPAVKTEAVQGKCAACKDEPMRKPAESFARDRPVAPGIVHETLASAGEPLDVETRAFFEPRFGYDFSRVRLHADTRAAESARSMAALGYTVGNHIVLGAGRLGQRALLAHELAHVVQQRAAPKQVQRFGSEEHVKIGERAEPGETIDLGPYVGKATYGEMIALGDYFDSVAQIMSEAIDPLFGAPEVQVALWKVNPSARSRPLVGRNVEDAVMLRYYELAAKNQTHFSKGSEPGKSNREQFTAMHQTAISHAYSQGYSGIIQGVSWEGWEGFAEHFLTDAFSAGHVRTPRHEIQAFWNGKYPKFTENLVDMICCYMASYINDRDTVGWVKTVDGLAEGIKPILLQKAGPVLNAFAFGDLISKVLHDADNMGLEVRSQTSVAGGSGPYVWRDLGDGYLYLLAANATPAMRAAQQQTQQMVEEAVRRSFAETQSAYQAGTKRAGGLDALLNPANFKALELIPIENLAAANPVYDWKANDVASLNATMQQLLIGTFASGQEIGDQIRGMTLDCVTQRSGFDLHTWEAWVCFRDTLLGGIIKTLDRIAKGDTCPPGQSNPCGTITTPCP
jgi:hypothetical protein